jgi:hypothetical protein
VRVITEYIRPPVPTTMYDWMAYIDGEPDGESNGPTGYGPTEADALRNLIEEAVEHFETLAYAEGRKDEREALGAEAPCPNCGGSGSITVPSDQGPDPEMLDTDCDHCGGKQTLRDAYNGVCQLLEARAMSHMHAVGRYLAARDALTWVMTATGEGIAGAFDNAEQVLFRLEGRDWRNRG